MKGKKQKIKSSKTSSIKPSKNTDNIILVVISLYFLVFSAPTMNIPDQMGMHWLLIGVLNLLSSLFILRTKEFSSSIQPIVKNLIIWLFLVFVLISGLSIFIAINRIESLVNYARLLSIVSAFLIFGVLLFRRIHLLKNLSFVIAMIVLAESYSGILQFYRGIGKTDLSVLVSNLQSNTGNKNIFAAALAVKIPIVIYAIFTRTNFLKYLSALSLFLAILAVLLINARSAYLGLMISGAILVAGLCYLQIKYKDIIRFKLSGFLVLGVYIVSFFISQKIIGEAIKFNSSTSYGTFGNRLSTVVDTKNSSTNIRLKYWKSSIDLIKERPIAGVGYGNWKLYAPLYTNTLLDDNVFSKHPHNDFLEIAGESGIPNSLIFLSIFIVSLIFVLKTIRSAAPTERKIIAVIILASLSGYFVDAFFNFPSERPDIQILFVFLLAVIIVTYIPYKSPDDQIIAIPSSINLKFGLATLILSGSLLYIHYTVFQSMKAQYIVDADLNSVDNLPDAMPKLSYAEVNLMFPSFPNIGENSELIGFKKAKYLQKEKRFEEAIKLLDSVQHQSPNLSYSDYLKCNIYLEQNKLDSAYKYAKKAAHRKPRNYYYYRMASYFARVNNDIAEIQSLFNRYHKYRQDQQSWSYYSLSMFYSNADRREVKKVIDSGLTYYPTDSIMLSYRPYLPK